MITGHQAARIGEVGGGLVVTMAGYLLRDRLILIN